MPEPPDPTTPRPDLDLPAVLLALQESVERYRTLFESIDEGFCVIEVFFDDDGRPVDYAFLEANPAFEQQTGLVNAVGHTARELVPALESHWFETYGRVAATGEPSRFQLGSDAMGRWFDVYAFRVGRPEEHRVAILFTDVSAAKRVEGERDRLLHALEVERARLAHVFQQAPAFLAVVRGPEHVFELVNEAYYQLVGHRPLIGRTVAAALPEVREQHFERLLDAVRETGVPHVGREVAIRLSRTPNAPAEERYVDFVYLPLTEADGTRSGVIAHGTDVTDQVLARREAERARERADRLQSLTAALAASTTVDGAAEVVVAEGVAATGAATALLAVRDPDATPDRAGAAPVEAWVLRQVGLPPAVGTQHRRFPITSPGPVAACLRTGQPFFLETREAVLARFPEIPETWDALGTQALATMPLAAAGEVVGAMSFTFTAPRAFPAEDREFFLALAGQAAQALERARLLASERTARTVAEGARREAEAANRAKADFLAVMSHELRTPLNAIGGYAELMEMGLHGPVTDAQREALARIQRSQRHLLGLINEVLNYAKLETGAVRYDLAPVHVSEALAEAEGLVMPQARAKGLALRMPDCPQDLVVRADVEKLRQILVNLLSNAVKFTDRGGRIDVACASDEAQVRLLVRDSGIGIAGDKLGAIFEPFVQVRADLTRTAEGTGLGLAISRDLARGMGGDIAVESQPGTGSTFTLTLPRVARD